MEDTLRIDLVHSHSHRGHSHSSNKHSSLQSRCARLGHEELRSFLDEDRLAPRYTNRRGQHVPAFATLHTVENGIQTRSASYDSADALIRDMDANAKSLKPQIAFLKGFPSPEWLIRLDSFFHIDPTIFNNYLRFRGKKEFPILSLLSSLNHVVRLNICSIGNRGTKGAATSQIEIDKLRMEASESQRLYEHDLGRVRDCKRGDSIVRAYYVLDEKHFIIEQEVLVYLIEAAGSWSDEAIQIRNQQTQAESNDYYGKYPQSASTLAEDYGKFLDLDSINHGPFHALQTLFQFTADAESLVLAALKAKISTETGYDSVQKQNLTLSNLTYYQDILKNREERLQETIDVIRRPIQRSWHNVSHVGDDQRTGAKSDLDKLLQDFESLHEWCRSLSEQCSQGVNIIMNNALLAESREAKLQALGLKKLTIVAFIFIPLSFTTSFFGMNFEVFGQGPLSIWIFFIVAAPMSLFSVFLIIWDYGSLWMYMKDRARRFASFFY
ncbi:MAG: hypothetical protein M1820_010757 [Bogoriella megaspora]|nr:MAG: hypothetical protein M1820_010757 [Bogoriella megaspora]